MKPVLRHIDLRITCYMRAVTSYHDKIIGIKLAYLYFLANCYEFTYYSL